MQLNTLPSTGFSFSPIHIPSHTHTADPVILPRRDLFDARFQLIASSSQENSEAEESEERVDVDSDLKFVEAPSDLIPGVYEGGLKTWECSVDLAAYLHDRLPSENVVGKRVLEVKFRHFEGHARLTTTSVCSLGAVRRYHRCTCFVKRSRGNLPAQTRTRVRARRLSIYKTITSLCFGLQCSPI